MSKEDRHILSLKSILKKIEQLSLKQKLLVLIVIWSLIFIPSIINHSYSQRNDHYQFYPDSSRPDNYSPSEWNVTTFPVRLDNTTEEGLLKLQTEGKNVTFTWVWNKDLSQGAHIGAVDVFFKESDGAWKSIRLRRSNNTPQKEVWSKEIEFKEDKEIKFYYRVGQTDIPTYDRRASIILEGKNPYEETRTGPPPLIHFFFIPATLLTAPIEVGGAFLSFNIYFSLFILLDSLLLFYSIKNFDESKAYFSSLIFILNPITIFTVHQDEPIIVFLMILPLFLLSRDRKFTSSLSIGIGTVAKIWAAFWIPVMMTCKGLRKIKYLIIIILSGLSVFLLFTLMWGEKVLWFLKFYGGTAGKANIGGISFWNYGLKMLKIEGSLLPTGIILTIIVLVELFVRYSAWKKDWGAISTIVAFFAVFLAFYPKVHWEYILLLLPFLSILAAEKDVYLRLFYAITIISSVTMFLGSLNREYVIFPFITSVSLTLLFIYIVINVYKEDGNISNIDLDI
ncbi:MAG: hypothetical protein V5A76_02015 [Candidatus Thermoplasmatota archaeon]